MAIVVTQLVVGGIIVDVYSHSDGKDPACPVNALFLLHGRTSAKEDVETTARAILDLTYGPQGADRKRDLDHRNHGSRLVDTHRNGGWHKDPAQTNAQHAIDMYAIQTGTAHDVTSLIDHIPSFLYPSGERNIIEWGMAGISLGGHSTWIALSREPRIQLAIPIIGCPDYTKLLQSRAQSFGVPFAPPYYPPQLKAYVDTHDPAKLSFREMGPSNPFLGKKILALFGAKDELVPWAASSDFIEGLEVGDGVKRIVFDENAGHECSAMMSKEAGLFVTEWLTSLP
ncbi:hypothetical protein F5I97DRAFT_1939454 [Phlebopus sp. FC_14]|nr:hypothetical protein F5I97DRAFT_1939454 [Phlebopus sp. FC_14]